MGKIHHQAAFQYNLRSEQKPLYRPQKKRREPLDHFEGKSVSKESKPPHRDELSLLQKGLEKEKAQFGILRGNQKKQAAKRINALTSHIASLEKKLKQKAQLRLILNVLMFLGGLLGKVQKIRKGVQSLERSRVKEKPEANPPVEPKHEGICVYQTKEKWELFSQRGPHMNDIRQGATGDCYFLAALAAVTNKTTDFVKEMITDNQDGTFNVRFFQPSSQGTYEPVWVTVNAELPHRNTGTECYSRSQDTDKNGIPEIWVPLVEKAFAQLIEEKPRLLSTSAGKGYQGIGSGGYSDEAFRVISGKEGWRYSIHRLEERELLERLSKANTGDYVAAGSSLNAPEHIPGRHAYSIQRVFEGSDGQTYVELRNPWGKMGTESGYTSEGVFNLSFHEFRQFFSSLYWAPV